MERIKTEYFNFCQCIQDIFDDLLQKHPQKKAFAEATRKYPFSPLLFTLWENSYSSTYEYFAIIEEKVFVRMWRQFHEKYQMEIKTSLRTT